MKKQALEQGAQIPQDTAPKFVTISTAIGLLGVLQSAMGPDSVTDHINLLVRATRKLVQEHIALESQFLSAMRDRTADSSQLEIQLNTLTTAVCGALTLIKGDVSSRDKTELKKMFCDCLSFLVEKSTREKVLLHVVEVIKFITGSALSNDSNLSMFDDALIGLLLKTPRLELLKDHCPKMFAAFVDFILQLYHGLARYTEKKKPPPRAKEVIGKLESVLMIGLRGKDVKVTSRFSALIRKRIGHALPRRMEHIFNQHTDREPMRKNLWIAQALHMILDVVSSGDRLHAVVKYGETLCVSLCVCGVRWE